MFSGIVQKVAKVTKIESLVGHTQLSVDLQVLAKSLKIDDSVAINGTCLTVVNITESVATFTVVRQTLAITNLCDLRVNDEVNIELSLGYGNVIGGHLVQGHIDATVEILMIESIGDAWQVTFSLPENLKNYIIAKGYVALDGASLTVHTLQDDCFSVALIPHTQAMTIAKHYHIGSLVNLEVDMLAKYVERNLRSRNEQY